MEEVSFPRGGAGHHDNEISTSTKKENKSSHRKTRKRTDSKDFLFGSSESTKRKKHKKKKNITENDTFVSHASSALPIGGGAVIQPSTKGSSTTKGALIEALSFQKIAKGTKFLGMIREVAPDYAVVSLPSMLTGFIRRDSKSDIGLNKVVSVGMILPVVVLRATAETISNDFKKSVVKRRIELSISPSLINSGLSFDTLYESLCVRGTIKSVEDHGCLVDLNITGVGASGSFLKFDNIAGKYQIFDTDNDEDETDDEKGCKDERFELNKGRIYDFTIISLPSKMTSGSSNIIQLKLETQNNRSTRVTESAAAISARKGSSMIQHTIRSLSPGMLCNVSVEHFARNGLCVTFLGNVFRGAIDSGNLGAYYLDNGDKKKLGHTNKQKNNGDMWWKDLFVGKFRTFPARVIAVDPTTKIIRLSILQHILSLTVPHASNFPLPGSIVENAKVVRLDPGIGALLAMPYSSDNGDESSDGMDMGEDDNPSNQKEHDLLSNDIYRDASKIKCAYVHISKALDNEEGRTPELQFNKKFSLNTTIPKLRILSSTNWMDNVASCATADSIVSSAVLTHNDLTPGAVYRSVPVIANLEGGGVLVQLGGMGLKGLVPAMHLFDKVAFGSAASNGDDKNSYRNKVRREKFKVGNKVDVRCLVTDAEEKKCILTAKKSLLNSDIDDPICTYTNIAIGRLATGFVSRVTKQGLTITFFNNVFGRVSARKLAEELGVEDPSIDYKCGDVLKVRIEKCSKMENTQHDSYHLDLSLDITSSVNKSENARALANDVLKPGMILPPKCMKIIELIPSRQHDEIETGHAVVSIKNKYLASIVGAGVEYESKGSFHCKVPYEHLLDEFDNDVVKSADSLDALVHKVVKVGKKIAQEGLIMQTRVSGSSQTMAIVSLKAKLIASIKQSNTTGKVSQSSPPNVDVIVPSPSTALFMGAYVYGYCVRLDPRYGAFIRFLGDLTGLVPKLKNGLDIALYETTLCKISAIDVTTGKAPKILLKRVKQKKESKSKKETSNESTPKMISDIIKLGEKIGDVRVDNINFARAAVTILDGKFQGYKVKARIHMTMAAPIFGEQKKMPLTRETETEVGEKDKITEHHPFYYWKVGSIIKETNCVAIDVRDGISYVELSNRVRKSDEMKNLHRLFVEDPSHLKGGDIVSGVITSISKENKGLWIQICPGVNGFVPGLELTDNADILNNMQRYYKIGGRVKCSVIDSEHEKGQFKKVVRLSALNCVTAKSKNVARGDILIGRVNRTVKQDKAPALMIELSGGLLARCDITELEDIDDWSNMPLGRDTYESITIMPETETSGDKKEENDFEVDENENSHKSAHNSKGIYGHGLYVRCRVLSSTRSKVEVSLRDSRIKGYMVEDEVPAEKDIVHAYVVMTSKKGCFIRLSRFIEGRVILKELSDSFLPDPISMFPPGRLVIGKVKVIKESGRKSGKARQIVDLDMRESTLLEDESKLKFEDVKEGAKHTGVVTRIESYGVFVRLDKSEVSGLVHLSECSDDYVKSLRALYNPGDLVKVLVTKVLKDKRQIGLSMKASHFEDDSDDDSDDNSDDNSSVSDADTDMKDSQSPRNNINTTIEFDHNDLTPTPASEKDSKGVNVTDDNTETSSDDSGSESSDDSSENSSSDEDSQAMDADVGFDWGTEDKKENKEYISESDDSDSDSDESMSNDSKNNKSSHKSRKKMVEKKQEEKRISEIEKRMADGTADENPETNADFERLLASNPNSSENWIRFMAYHLSLADIESARKVANRAFDRIEFRQEGEKLNVWTALIALESKYGSPTTFDGVILRASQHNNPKQVYLRACETLESKLDGINADDIVKKQTDEMFAKMCKKFKSKKTVWISHFKYLLKSARHDEAHNLRKRCLISLPSYKHVETMSKFAQLEYEYGSIERARTIFDALFEKHPKRMDLLFVCIDKEIKHGDIATARRLFEKKINPPSGVKKVKYSDKQMKSLFKKWYRMEDAHGDDQCRMNVKMAAKEYVERSSKTK